MDPTPNMDPTQQTTRSQATFEAMENLVKIGQGITEMHDQTDNIRRSMERENLITQVHDLLFKIKFNL